MIKELFLRREWGVVLSGESGSITARDLLIDIATFRRKFLTYVKNGFYASRINGKNIVCCHTLRLHKNVYDCECRSAV